MAFEQAVWPDVDVRLAERATKRSLDLIVSAALLGCLLPFLVVVAAIVWLESPGSPVLVQRRVGRRGRVFPMLKVRTMRADAEADGGPVFALPDDPRCTRLGRLIRRTNVDELPQLINVLAGDMSLVGPRPERPEFVQRFRRVIPRYDQRHAVRPGITGWAQVHGLRGSATSLPARIQHDLHYIEHWSLTLDLRILVRTALDFLWITRPAVPHERHAMRGRSTSGRPAWVPVPSVQDPECSGFVQHLEGVSRARDLHHRS